MPRRFPFRFKTKKDPKKVHDIVRPRKRRVLSLRPKTLKLELQKKHIDAGILWIKNNRVATASLLVLIVILLRLFVGAFSYAEVAQFYPTSCLGGWEHSDLVDGKPDSQFAKLDNSVAELYCGGFTGDVPKDTQPKRVFVAFASHIETPEVITAAPVEDSSATTTITDDNLASSTQQILDLPSDTPSEIKTPEEKQPEQIPETPAQPEAPSEPVTWLPFSSAYAAEINSVDSLKVSYTLDGVTWLPLGTVSRENLNQTRFEIPASVLAGWYNLDQLQVSISSSLSLNDEPAMYLDSMWLEVEYENIDTLSENDIKHLPRVEVNQNDVFNDTKTDFRSNENAEFEIDLGGLPQPDTVSPVEVDTTTASSTEDRNASTTVSLKGVKKDSIFSFFTPEIAHAETFAKKKVLSAKLFGPDGSEFDKQPEIIDQGGKVSIRIPQNSKSFRPGTYKMEVEVLSDDKVLVTTREFTWGVLAINTNRSSYSNGDQVYLQIGALNAGGHTLCDANLRLEITDPTGTTHILSTNNGELKHSDTCGKNNVTDNPDYLGYFKIQDGEGKYQMDLTNTDNGFHISDSFKVRESPFVVKRSGATRINPFASTYTMNMTIKAMQVFDGDIRESVPTGFEIVSGDPTEYRVVKTDAGQEIIWNKEIKKGDTVDLSYTYQAPEISPELFILGPIILSDGNADIFHEERTWQLASDGTCNATATGNWNDASKWSAGCSGLGGIPDATDDVTINSGVTMTVTADAPVRSIVVAANASATNTNGIVINSGITLTVSVGVSMTAPTALTSTIDVGNGTLNAQSIAIAGSVTAGRFATVSVTNGFITTTGSTTFSGTAAQARFTTTGTATVTIGGNFGSGGTLATAAGTTFILNGSVAQTMGIYLTYKNVTISNTSGGVTILGTTTFTGNLVVSTSSAMTIGAFALTVTGTTNVNGTLTINSATGLKTFTGQLVVSSTGTYNNSGNAAPTISGGITNNGTFTAGTAVYTFSVNSQALSGNAFTFSSVTVTGVTLTSNVNLTVTAALIGTGGLTMAANLTLTIGGSSTITTLTVNNTGSVVNYNGAGAQTIKGTSYVTLKVNNTVGGTLGAATTLTNLIIGDVTAASIFADGGFTITLNSSSSLNLNQGTYRDGSSGAMVPFPAFSSKTIATGTTIEYASNLITQAIDSTVSYSNLAISGSGIKTPDGPLTVGGNITLTAIGGGGINFGSFSHTVTGNITVAAGGGITGSSSTITLQGSWTGAGSFTGNTSTVVFTGTAAQSLSVTTNTFNNLTINKTSGTVTTGAALTVGGVLNINDGNFTIGAFTTTITGSTTISDTLTFSSVTATKVFNGLVTLSSGAVWNNAINSPVQFHGGITNNGGTFTAGSGTHIFDTSNQELNGSVAFSIPNLSVGGVLFTNNVTLTVSTTLGGTGSLVQGASGVLNIGGTSAITGLVATSTGNIVNYNGVASQTVKATSYDTLKINNTLASGAVLGGAVTLTNLVIADTTTGVFDDGTFAITLNPSSSITMGSAGTYNVKTATFPTFNSNTLNVASTIVYASTSAQTVASAPTYGNLSITGAAATKTVDGSLTVMGNVTVNASTGTLNLGTGFSHSVIGNVTITLGTINGGSSGLSVQGNWTGVGTFTGSTGSVTFSGTNAQTISVTTDNFNNLTVDKASNTATVTVALTASGALNVANGTLSIGGVVTTVTGSSTISGTLTLTSATGAKTFTGLVTINNGGTWTETAAAIPTFRRGIINNGTYTSSTGIHTFDTNNQSLDGSSSLAIPNTTVTGVVLTNNITLTVATALSGTGGLTQGTNAFLNIGAASAITSMTATATPNTVSYTGVAQTVKATDYYNLSLSGSGAKGLTNVAQLYGDLSISGTATAATAIGLTINGNVSIGSGTTLTVAGFIFHVLGTTSVSGTLAHSSSVGGEKDYNGVVTINSGGVWTNAGNSTIGFVDGLIFNGTTFTAGSGAYSCYNLAGTSCVIGGSNALTIPTLVAFNSGREILNTSTAGLTVTTALSGSGIFTQYDNAVLNLGGTSAVTTLNATSSGNIVNYNGAGAQTIKDASYQTLKVNNSAGATLGGASTLTVLTIGDTNGASIFADGGFAITLNASSVLNLTLGTFKLGTAGVATTFPAFGTVTIGNTTTVEYASGLTQTIDTSQPYYNLTISGGATKTLTGAINLPGNLTVNASGGTLNLGTGLAHTVAGNVTITLGTLNGGSSTLDVQGSWTGAGTFTGNASTVTFSGTNAQTVSATTDNFFNLSVNKTSGTVSQTGTTNVLGMLNVADGTYSIGGVALTVTGSTTVSDTLAITSATGGKIFTGLVTLNTGALWTTTGNPTSSFRGGIINSSGSTFSPGTGIQTFDTNAQSLNGNDFNIPNLTVTTIVLTNNASTTVSTALAGTGTLTQGANSTLNLGGTSALTTFIPGGTGNTVNYNGGSQTVKTPTGNHYNLIFSGSGTKTMPGSSVQTNDFTMTGSAASTMTTGVTVTGALTVGASNTFTVNGGVAVVVTGTTTISGSVIFFAALAFTGPVIVNSGATWTAPGNVNTFGFRGGFTNNSASFNAGSATFNFATNSQTIEGTAPTIIPGIIIDSGITVTNNNTNLTVTAGNISGAGTLLQGANSTLAIRGSITITNFDASTNVNTVKYTSTTSAQTVKLTPYSSLIIDKSGQTATLSGSTTLNGSLTITAGTLDVSTSNYALTVKGDWTNNGTFTSRGGTVRFSGSGNQTINDANSWYGLAATSSVARTIYFESGAAQTIASGGSLTFTGASGQLLTLAPLTAATPWLLQVNPTGVTQSISYVSPSYSNAGPVGVNAEIAAYDGTNNDGGNNTNWNFVGNLTFSISDNTIGFGALTPSGARYATGDTTGAGTETTAHTITAGSQALGGYSLSVQGNSLSCGSTVISPIGGSNVAPVPGTEQFGIRLDASGGAGVVASPYDGSGFAFGATPSTPSQIASASTSGANTTYSVKYVSDVSPSTAGCTYSTNLTYVMTSNF